MTTPVLIETCLELGPFDEAQIAEDLAGSANHPHIKAILSWIEYKIGIEHATSSTRGCDRQLRDEACGAADALKSLRGDLLAFAKVGLHDQDEPS